MKENANLDAAVRVKKGEPQLLRRVVTCRRTRVTVHRNTDALLNEAPEIRVLTSTG